VNAVAVVMPMYRLPQTTEELQSLSIARGFLASHPRFIISPQSLKIPTRFLKGEQLIRLPDKFFIYPDGYNRMLMGSRFYEAFEQFNYILIYQLDCLVFRDELDEWCAKDYDYIGSPWRDNYSDDSSEASWKVGNGGFSLRKVSTALRVLRKRIKRGSIYPVPPPYRPRPGFWNWLIENSINRLKQHLNLWTVEDELQNYRENEDRWWSIDVLKVVSDYKKPTVEEALRFGFEVEPRECLKMTGGKLPFGCHAWWKQDREFWEEVLKQQKLS
jgi:hypothetical protein